MIESQIMKKFCRNQAIFSLDIPLPEELCAVLPDGFRQKMNISCNLKCDYIHLIRFSQYSLDKIASFEFSTNLGIDLLQPYYQDVFNSDIAEQLESMYKPNYNVSSISRFYRKFGRATIAGDLIGSHLPGQNSRTSSVEMAYWPSSTELAFLILTTAEWRLVLCNTS